MGIGGWKRFVGRVEGWIGIGLGRYIWKEWEFMGRGMKKVKEFDIGEWVGVRVGKSGKGGVGMGWRGLSRMMRREYVKGVGFIGMWEYYYVRR